jgi:CRP-like cAMP-binding protein
MVKNSDLPLQNKLLAALPSTVFDLLSPHFITETLTQGTVVAQPGDELDQIYFPHSGMISILAVLQDGKAIETATVGLEGVVGAMAGFGLYTSLVRCVVQLPMEASRISAVNFRKVAASSDRSAHARISCRNAGRSTDIRHRNCNQNAKRRGHHVFTRRDMYLGPASFE